MPSSPFRFVMIDDPVQAMDDSRVDGLARVLGEIAQDRQVIVFSHDERLSAACRHLGVAARVIEVIRGSGSKVVTRKRNDPARDLVNDAESFRRDNNTPLDVKRRVIPGLCREALEACAVDLIWRRRLDERMSHEDIEVALEDAHKLTEKLSLLAFGDAGRTGDLYSHLNNKYGAWATDLVKELNAGAHGDASVEAIDAMVGTTARFVELLDPQKRE